MRRSWRPAYQTAWPRAPGRWRSRRRHSAAAGVRRACAAALPRLPTGARTAPRAPPRPAGHPQARSPAGSRRAAASPSRSTRAAATPPGRRTRPGASGAPQRSARRAASATAPRNASSSEPGQAELGGHLELQGVDLGHALVHVPLLAPEDPEPARAEALERVLGEGPPADAASTRSAPTRPRSTARPWPPRAPCRSPLSRRPPATSPAMHSAAAASGHRGQAARERQACRPAVAAVLGRDRRAPRDQRRGDIATSSTTSMIAPSRSCCAQRALQRRHAGQRRRARRDHRPRRPRPSAIGAQLGPGRADREQHDQSEHGDGQRAARVGQVDAGAERQAGGGGGHAHGPGARRVAGDPHAEEQAHRRPAGPRRSSR